MRISDWSSDVCSSDLEYCRPGERTRVANDRNGWRGLSRPASSAAIAGPRTLPSAPSSEERRVGKEWVSTCRSRRSPDHYKTNKNILSCESDSFTHNIRNTGGLEIRLLIVSELL